MVSVHQFDKKIKPQGFSQDSFSLPTGNEVGDNAQDEQEGIHLEDTAVEEEELVPMKF